MNAEEYVLSDKGQHAIDATADGDFEDEAPEEGSEGL